MPRTRRLVSVAAALTATAALAGCGLSEDAPRPGVAAEVEGTPLALDDLEALLDAACINTAATEGASATSRDATQLGLLQQWIGSSILLAFAEEEGIETTAPDLDDRQIAGWDEMDEHEQEMLADYFARQQRAEQAVQAAGEAGPDPADYDIEINPVFDMTIEDGSFVAADQQLSVAVSDGAAVAGVAEELSAAQVAALPESQLCGARPDPGAMLGG